MSIAFINRSQKNFKPSDELAAINAHCAHIRHERKRIALREAARTRNMQVSRYIEGANQRDAQAIRYDALLIGRHIGSLRDDPFWTIPVDNSHNAMMSFDYLFQVICPLALNLGNYSKRQHEIVRLNILETPMYCSSMIALGLILRSLHMDNTIRLSRAALYHLNNAVAGLRVAVADPLLSTSDLVLGTICCVAIVYRLLNDYAAYNAHVNGVRRIVDLRGGLDTLGWEGFSKISVIGMFESAGVLHRQQNQLVQDEGIGLILTAHKSILEYPSCPLTAGLQEKISHYPRGIGALALNCRLSLQFLNFFQIFFDWYVASTSTPGPHDSMTELGHEILSMPGLTFIERLLALAIQAYINWLERTVRKWSNFSSEHEVEVHVEVLKGSEAYVEACTDERRDAFAWCCLMLRDTTTKGSLSRRWAETHLARMSMYGDSEEELDRLFFTRPGRRAVNEDGFLMSVCPSHQMERASFLTWTSISPSHLHSSASGS